MQASLYIAFVGVSVAVILFPGPSILLIVANSLQRGVVIGLYTVVGGVIAMAIQIVVALVGLTSVASAAGIGFDYIRGFGAAYLLYLGIRRWRGVTRDGVARGRVARSYGSAVVEGFVVALTNPGTMLFFVAFFPQFLDSNAPPGQQFVIMAVTFMVLVVVLDSAYALLASRIGRRLHESRQTATRNRLSGGLLIVAAIVLAFINV